MFCIRHRCTVALRNYEIVPDKEARENGQLIKERGKPSRKGRSGQSGEGQTRARIDFPACVSAH